MFGRISYSALMATAFTASAMSTPFLLGNDTISGGLGHPRAIHRRGKFKPNARRQKGRKTLPPRKA